MDKEIALAMQFRDKLVQQRTSFSPNVESAISKAFSHATIFDIETGGLQPTSPIYEMGFQHGINSPTFRHAFVRPTDLSGTNPGDISGFTQDLLRGREKTSPGTLGAIHGSTLSQRQAALRAHATLSGRDIWVQNLAFERRFMSERISKGGFNKWAERSQLESFTPGGGIYTTSPALKRSIVEANSAKGSMTSLDSYLSKWSSVFGEMDKVLQGPRQQGMTRAFDMLDLTRSVFAMAQQKGHMAKTGELYAGTSIDSLSRALYKTPELHTALGDAALQGELTRFLYGTGKMMQEGESLSSAQRDFFKRISEAQPVQRQRDLTKNIINTFRDQQRFLGEEALGNRRFDLLEGSRVDRRAKIYRSDLNVLQEDGSYKVEQFSRGGRDYSNPRYSTNIEEVVEAWRRQGESQHGIKLDYSKAMHEANQYIGPYNQRLTELGGDRLAALSSMESVAENIHNRLNQTVSEAFSSGVNGKGWLKRNWKLAAGSAAAIGLLGNLFSGKGSEYNYIEGMRHQGFAGETRPISTDFASPWQGLKKGLEALKTGAAQNKRTAGMIGLGAIAGVARYEEDKESSGLLNSAGSMLKGIGIALATNIVVPPILGTASLALASRASGGSLSFSNLASIAKGTFKSNFASLKATFGAYKNIHTGENAKELFAEAASKGVDLSTKAKFKRFGTGITEPAGKLAKHTAAWLGEHWLPKAEKFDPAASLLALATGYEAAHIVGDAVNLDLGGVATGALTFAGAKYAYMGWHHRDKIKSLWSSSNRKDKLFLASAASTAISSATSFIPEAIHANFAHARYGLSHKEFYSRFGGEVAGNFASEMENMKTFMEATLPSLSPQIQEELGRVISNASAGAKRGVERIRGTTRDDIKRQFKGVAREIDKAMSGDQAKARWESDYEFGISSGLSEEKSRELADELASETPESKNIFNDKKNSLLGGLLRKKADNADYDSIFNLFDTARSRAEKAYKNKPRITIPSKDDHYNTIEGLQHRGVAGATRAQNTDFGSGWRGLVGYSAKLGENLTPRREAALDILAFVTSSRASDKTGFYSRVPSSVQKQMDLSVAAGQEYPIFINRDAFIERENIFRDTSGVLAGITSMERGASAITGQSWWRRFLNKGQLSRSNVRIDSIAKTQADLVTPGEDIKATILHERFHQKVQNDIDAYREVKAAIVPEEFARIFREVSYGPDALIAEEYLAHKKQFERYPRTLRRSPFFSVFQPSAQSRVSSNVGGNTIQGFPEAGVAGVTRKDSTNFGSPWQGQGNIDDENAQKLLKGRRVGLNSRYTGPVASMEIQSYNVEDADTVQIMLAGGKQMSLRLAGIDAPEIEHGDDYASGKVFQRQPFGEEATQMLKDLMQAQSNLTMVFDPTGENTYGRTPALLFGDNGLNINLSLVEQGAAASLPFGNASERLFSASEFNAAQEEAYEAELGMWSDRGWRAAHDVQRGSKRKLTHNTFTDLERLFSNFRASSVVHRLRNPDAEFSEMFAAGGRDDFNIEEGLRHGWAQANREANLGDFGSGYRIDKVIETMRKNTKVHQKLQRGQYVANTHSRRMMDQKNWTRHHVG